MAHAHHSRGLTGNQLKILALIFMTADHIGLQLLPELPALRCIGRLAFPVFAWMIAEGCRYTHDKKGYLLRLGALAGVCQVVYFAAMGSLYQCVLVTFFLSALLIFAYHRAAVEGSFRSRGVFLLLAAGVVFLAAVLPALLSATDYAIDYGLWGIALPLGIYAGKTRLHKLGMLTLGLIGLAVCYGGIQWLGLGAVPLLALYNGRRGTHKIGTFFYLYYPAHLVVLFGISLLLT